MFDAGEKSVVRHEGLEADGCYPEAGAKGVDVGYGGELGFVLVGGGRERVCR